MGAADPLPGFQEGRRRGAMMDAAAARSEGWVPSGFQGGRRPLAMMGVAGWEAALGP